MPQKLAILIRTPVPAWSVAALLFLIFMILASAQRPIVEALWRKHHPAITDAMRSAIDQEEKRIEKEKYDELMARFNQTLGETGAQPSAAPQPQKDEQNASQWWQQQKDQYDKERAERAKRLGLSPSPGLPPLTEK